MKNLTYILTHQRCEFISRQGRQELFNLARMAIEKIVVVDDEMMIRKALETQLRNKEYSVASTGDLKGARKFWQEILLIWFS